MSSETTPEECTHMMLERLKDEHPVLDINGHGKLSAVFKCGQCGQLFYALRQSGEHKKAKTL